jgi:UDP-2,4-diacetamido-2,4,6-trideoxy-beta-L-altropyranose hydrolase
VDVQEHAGEICEMNGVKIAFRADASLQMGTGHIMRCLTLAEELAATGAECQFICREHSGNLIKRIREKGFLVHALPAPNQGANPLNPGEAPLAHAHWLGASWQQDAEACEVILSKLRSDWLVVDHYALDVRWETSLKRYYDRLMVIDDLADRQHECDLLLDQTLSRNTADYKSRVADDCMLLCGSHYALLRPEFAALRAYSLQRRSTPKLRRLLITMGGVDKDNATGQVLQALTSCNLREVSQIVVVMGATAPWLDYVKEQAERMPWPTIVEVGVIDMAQLMADSDLAIGAAGATSWERCCLGLPTLMFVLAENQKAAAVNLEQAGAVTLLSLGAHLREELIKAITQLTHNKYHFKSLAEHAKKITDGTGCQFVAGMMRNLMV